jgi:putative ABC transport system substrate-binding protein
MQGAGHVRRRTFIAALGGAAALPFAARAQQSAMPVVGYFDSASLEPSRIAGFRRGLNEAGYVEGQNVAIEFRAVRGRYEQLPAQAAALVNRPVNLILGGGLPTTRAAKAATTTIPIVFVMGADPVKLGIVASLNQPGGNITGVCQLFGGLGAKRLEVLRELIPQATAVAVVSNPKNPNARTHLEEVATAAYSLGQSIEVFTASTEADIDNAFARIAERRLRALLVADDPLFTVRREQLVALAVRYAIPTMYYSQEFGSIGGLISYGSNAGDNYRLAGGYVGRILKGAKPGELPVILPTKYYLLINLNTAKTLQLAIPPTLLARADEVIE